MFSESECIRVNIELKVENRHKQYDEDDDDDDDERRREKEGSRYNNGSHTTPNGAHNENDKQAMASTPVKYKYK